MSLNWPKAGANYVPAYQISGIPYVTRSAAGEITTTAVKVSFPYVTRFFVVGNNSLGDLRVGFTENGVSATETANYFKVKPFTSGAIRYEVRCKELWFRNDDNANAGFEIMAGLTNVHADQFPVLSGALYTYGFESAQNNGVVTSSWPGVG